MLDVVEGGDLGLVGIRIHMHWSRLLTLILLGSGLIKLLIVIKLLIELFKLLYDFLFLVPATLR